jgi:tRNA-2-methylthio-N6-dimethylallyladenosine synthase
MNTCAIRDNAEQRVRQRLTEFRILKKHNPGLLVGVLGCMAEEPDDSSNYQIINPDSYRESNHQIKAVNVLLSREETYDDISPVRLSGNGVTAFISIMRGCDNMCSFCVVPFTRGRERSRDPETIVKEAKELFESGYREVTLLGQNVDSYNYSGQSSVVSGQYSEVNNQEMENSISFASLLAMVAEVSPKLRVRFSTSNPQDMTDEVVNTIAKYPNICKYIHLPVQSGSSRVLKLMNRGYDREMYLNRIEYIRNLIPDCGLSTDIIAGFCSETEDEHYETISLIKEVKYDYAYTFAYSERPGTPAAKKMKDDITDEVKAKRVQEIIAIQRQHSLEGNKADIGKKFEVLVEGISKRSKEQVFGRNSQNKVIIFDSKELKAGDYANVIVTGCTSGTLLGHRVEE